MIKILIPIMILVISTANGLSFSLSSTNDYGTSFTDGFKTNGNVDLSGIYLLSSEGSIEDLTAQVDAKVGAGSFSEHTEVSHGGTHHQSFDYSVFKSVDNIGSGTAISNTQAYTNGEMAGISSYLQTDSNVDHGSVLTSAVNGVGTDLTMADWHFENVQAKSDLNRMDWNDFTYSVQINSWAMV